MPKTSGAQSLTQTAYERLRADVLACRLRPGERLRIAELAAACGVSPGAVREALSRLTSDGLVVAEPQRGFRVTPISNADLEDLTAVRADIEAQCLRRAIGCGTIDWESEIVAAYHRLSRIPDRAPDDPGRLNDAWAAQHAAYHDALVAACDSPWLLRLRAMLYAQGERYRRLSVPLARTARDVDREHRDIMDAAVGRDADRAAALLTAHIRSTTQILLDAGRVADEAVAAPV